MDWLATLPHCAIYGKPILAGLLVFGDFGTWVAYMAIPIAIEAVRYQRGIPYNGLAVLFGCFIMLCGAGHLVDMFSMVTGADWAYWLKGAISLSTAIVSLITAYCCWQLIPQLIDYPTAHDWFLMRRRLKIYEDRERARLGLPEAAR
jgi:hypothetical protein